MKVLRLTIVPVMETLDNFRIDKRLTADPFFGSAFFMFACLSVYMLVVLKLGPQFMKNRKPYNVDHIMRLYNVMQIFLNLFAFYEMTRYSYWRSDFNLLCEGYNPQDVRPATMGLTRPIKLYLISKYLDFFDTFFFLLRKKFNQITFLHVYHHILMVSATHSYGSQLFASHFTSTGVVNSFIHVIMYTYYLVASLKPNINLNKWKKMVTQLQLLQFGLLAIHYGLPLFFSNQCNVSIPWLWVAFLNNACIMGLFSNFYYKTYIRARSKQHSVEKAQ
uniref:Elongation of very long chain fatty acids protein n=2 Tax=Stomoxys calcitrans TaxID=35570 RepID=A0A1I8P0A4_STOCA